MNNNIRGSVLNPVFMTGQKLERMENAPDRFQDIIVKILSAAGVRINGEQLWDIQVYNKNFYRRIALQGSLGFGESYMEGWWDCKALDELFFRLMRAKTEGRLEYPRFYPLALRLAEIFANRQSRSKAFEVGERHYDIGNDLYRIMLDRHMVYTCAYWKNARDLDEAQEAKLDLVCRKAGLKPGMSVLDIGCGWGGFAQYAAEHYDVAVVGITVSKEQAALGRDMCRGLPIDIRFQDYRDLNERFDRIVSLGMFEHVGYKNYRAYMEIVNECLKDDGLFVLQTIGENETSSSCDPWLDKYIFPRAAIPSIPQIGAACEGLFVIEDWQNFSADYDKTLTSWFRNFDDGWPALQGRYGDKFYRMWKYYLLSCAGLFRARKQQLWQIVLSKHGVPGGYRTAR